MIAEKKVQGYKMMIERGRGKRQKDKKTNQNKKVQKVFLTFSLSAALIIPPSFSTIFCFVLSLLMSRLSSFCISASSSAWRVLSTFNRVSSMSSLSLVNLRERERGATVRENVTERIESEGVERGGKEI
jgi:hypothetical protein